MSTKKMALAALAKVNAETVKYIANVSKPNTKSTRDPAVAASGPIGNVVTISTFRLKLSYQ